MKSRMLMTAACIVLLGAPLAATAQPTLDLSITGLNYETVSPGMVTFEALVHVISAGAADPFTTEVSFFLDGSPVTSAMLIVGPITAGSCTANVPPNCAGTCPTIMMDGSPVSGVCVEYEAECNCLYLQSVNSSSVPEGSGELSAIIDPDNLVEEMREDNNSHTGPVAVNITTWGIMKALYR